MNCTVKNLQQELHNIKQTGMYDVLHRASTEIGVDFAFVLAIGSRETNLVNEIGDGGHGVGIMQIDTQHSIAAQAEADGTWSSNPQALVNYGVQMLADNLKHAEIHYPKFDKYKIAAAAYNAGWGNVCPGILNHGNADQFTTGGDYGADVVERMQVFQKDLGVG